MPAAAGRLPAGVRGPSGFAGRARLSRARPAAPDSDIDLLLVVDPLPNGRLARLAEFEAVERLLGSPLTVTQEAGLATRLSPVFKTPEEVRVGSPLFLDMVDDALILWDRDQFFERRLDKLRRRLGELGAGRAERPGSALRRVGLAAEGAGVRVLRRHRFHPHRAIR